MAHDTKADTTHIVNISGGKDSQAAALIAALRGKPFRLVMADTGNENELTLEHAHYVADFVGVNLEMCRADFSEQIAKKREFVQRKWAEQGVPADRIERALAVLRPTGNPFLDLCIWKGRFPSRMAQFCTEFLKSRVIEDGVVTPALQHGHVVQWLGVRRDESLNRRNAPMFQRVRRDDTKGDILMFRPIIHWTAENVFSFTAAHGMKPNPLYKMGMGRVGCFPCINAGKSELRQIKRRFPEAVEKLMEWEALVAEASKRGATTFFAATATPEGAALSRKVKRDARIRVRRFRPELDQHTEEFQKAVSAEQKRLVSAASWPGADKVFEWSETARGGRQWEMSFDDAGVGCSSQYGLCE